MKPSTRAVVVSRHYRFDVEDGLALARKVSAKPLQVGIPIDRPFTPFGR